MIRLGWIAADSMTNLGSTENKTPEKLKVALAAQGLGPSALQLLRLAYSWHSLWSQYSQLGVAVQLAPGFAAQNAAEQSLPGVGGGGVGGEGAEQDDGKGTLKVKLVATVWVVLELIEQLQPNELHDPVGPIPLHGPVFSIAPPHSLEVLVANTVSQVTLRS